MKPAKAGRHRLLEFTLWLAPAGKDLLTTTNAIRDVQAAGCHAVRCEIDERQLAAY